MRHRERPVAVGRRRHRSRHAPGGPGPPRPRHGGPHPGRRRRGASLRAGRAGVRAGGGHADRERTGPARRPVRPRPAADRHRLLRRQRARRRPGRAHRRRAHRARTPGGDADEPAGPGHRPVPFGRPHGPGYLRAQRAARVHHPRRGPGGLGHPAHETRRGAARGRRNRGCHRDVGRSAHDAVRRAPAALDRVRYGPLPLLRRSGRPRPRGVRPGHAVRRPCRPAPDIRAPAQHRRRQGPVLRPGRLRGRAGEPHRELRQHLRLAGPARLRRHRDPCRPRRQHLPGPAVDLGVTGASPRRPGPVRSGSRRRAAPCPRRGGRTAGSRRAARRPIRRAGPAPGLR